MLEGLKKFFTKKEESKSENQRNSGNGVDSEKHSNDNVEQQENLVGVGRKHGQYKKPVIR